MPVHERTKTLEKMKNLLTLWISLDNTAKFLKNGTLIENKHLLVAE